MPKPQPAPEHCNQCNELLESIKAIANPLLDLHQREIEAVKKDDIEELERLDRELKKAMEFERSLFERFTSHIKSHGCRNVEPGL